MESKAVSLVGAVAVSVVFFSCVYVSLVCLPPMICCFYALRRPSFRAKLFPDLAFTRAFRRFQAAPHRGLVISSCTFLLIGSVWISSPSFQNPTTVRAPHVESLTVRFGSVPAERSRTEPIRTEPNRTMGKPLCFSVVIT